MKRALVLGGGGNVGIAWEIAILAGLLDGGVDARDADLIVGTSAGSVVGTHIAGGRDPRELLRERRTQPAQPLGNIAPDMSQVASVFALWASFNEMTRDACAAVGRLALAAATIPEAQWVESFTRNGWSAWPEKPLLVTAVECESGEFRTFDSQQGVPIERAVAASCSVPGLFPPVSIDGRRYTDGGVRSASSADVAQRGEPDRVLIVAPIGTGGRGIHILAARQLAQEMAALESAGASVRLIHLDEATQAAIGPNLMDPVRALPAAEAGEAYARRHAAELRDWWG